MAGACIAAAADTAADLATSAVADTAANNTAAAGGAGLCCMSLSSAVLGYM